MGNSINNLKNNSSHARDINSNEPKSNESSSSRIPRPSLPREEIPREEERIAQSNNSTIDTARAYASLEPEFKELITFEEFCDHLTGEEAKLS